MHHNVLKGSVVKVIAPSVGDRVVIGLSMGAGAVLVLFLVIGMVGGVEKIIIPLLLLCLWSLFVQIWVSRFRVTLNQDSITYAKPLERTRTILKDDIKQGRFSINALNFPRPIYLLEITHVDPDVIPLEINVKMFSFQDVRFIEDWLGEKAVGELRRSAIFDRRA